MKMRTDEQKNPKISQKTVKSARWKRWTVCDLSINRSIKN